MTMFTDGELQTFERMMQSIGKYERTGFTYDTAHPSKKENFVKKDGGDNASVQGGKK